SSLAPSRVRSKWFRRGAIAALTSAHLGGAATAARSARRANGQGEPFLTTASTGRAVVRAGAHESQRPSNLTNPQCRGKRLHEGLQTFAAVGRTVTTLTNTRVDSLPSLSPTPSDRAGRSRA